MGLGITASIFGATILIPPARELFHFGLLHGRDLAAALFAGLALLVVLGLMKQLVRPLSGARH